MTLPNTPARVLIVDDDRQMLRLHSSALSRAGFHTETAVDGQSAIEAMRRGAFDVILTDIDMPGMNGMRLLEQVRAHDADVPVILITGAPSFDTAVEALNRGALRYISKPIRVRELVDVTCDAVRFHHIATAKRAALTLIDTEGLYNGDQTGLSVSFDRALTSISLAYQPIVSWSEGRVVAYEALLRCREDSLPGPAAVLDAAERLGRVRDLGRCIRSLAMTSVDRLPAGTSLYLNIHPLELLDDDFINTPATERVTLEVTERRSLDDIDDARARVSALRDHGYRLALDDFGAGYGGLTTLALLQPDVVKIDMALVRNIEREPVKLSLVKTITQMCGELGIDEVAEGIETTGERDALVDAGCDLLQGYLFAKPATSFINAAF